MVSEDQVKFLGGIIASVPLSYLLLRIKSTQQKYLYSFILGTLLQFFVYGFDLWMPFLVHLIIYSIVKIKGRNCGALVTGISIVALSGFHIYRMIVDYGNWTLDISTILMPMVCKYSLFAYAYQDGGKQSSKLTPIQEAFKLEKLPTLYQYLVYCTFLPTCVIGTALEFRDFKNYMEAKAPFNNISGDKILKKIGLQFGYALICGGFYVLHEILFPLTTMKDHSFAQRSPLFILCFSFFSVTLLRFKYYFGWKLSQCAVHASGVSYDDKGQFDRIKTCDPWTVQTTVHLREKVSNWNMSCQLWLRRCIYQRAPFKNKQISQAYVFVISSFWHGFYGGYYLSFGFWFLQINLSTKVFKFVQDNPKHPFIKIYQSLGIIGEIIMWIGVNLLFSHNGLYFQILEGSLGFEILKQLYFIPPLIIVGGIVYFGSFSKGTRRPKTQTPGADDSAKQNKRSPAKRD